MNELATLRMIVTGGASGIGRAVAVAALERGAKVAVLDLDLATARIRSITAFRQQM